ncbi:hypothetical protein CPC08DRAFT_364013 [Agrocybe pediades]|nr:hypothetical protein CPC08DRAFT_364013 [Agrocybe pediades]
MWYQRCTHLRRPRGYLDTYYSKPSNPTRTFSSRFRPRSRQSPFQTRRPVNQGAGNVILAHLLRPLREHWLNMVVIVSFSFVVCLSLSETHIWNLKLGWGNLFYPPFVFMFFTFLLAYFSRHFHSFSRIVSMSVQVKNSTSFFYLHASPLHTPSTHSSP